MLLLTCVKGLEDILVGEIEKKLADYKLVNQSPGFVLIDYNGHPRRLLDLRSAEDVFYVIFTADDFTRSRSSLTKIKELVQQNSFDDALKYHTQIYSKPRHTNFQVFAHLYGRWNFRRADLEKAVNTTIDQKFKRWKPVHGKARLEFDVRLFKDGEVFFSLRLTDKFFSNRKYKKADIPGSLKPTVAYGMVYLSKPQEDDIVLDPFCGAGTILTERSLVAPAQKIIGADTSEEALLEAKENTGGRENIELHNWDALQLPLEDGSVSVIITNPPFGKKIEMADDLISKFIKEATRLLRPSGRLILLHSDIEKVEKSFSSAFEVSKYKDIRLLGEPARIWALRKK